MSKLLRTQLFPSTAALEPTEVADPKSKEQFVRFRRWADKLTLFLDEGFRKIASIPFNQSQALTVADSGSANAEFTVSHNLGRIPNGFILTKSDKACNVYDSGSTWTTSALYLKCDAANVALSLSIF